MEADTIVVGAGIAGCLLAWTLENDGQRILLVDSPDISHCSRVAAGILNPISGRRFTPVWRAETFFPAAIDTYRQIESRLNRKLFHPLPIVRLLTNPDEQQLWLRRRTLPELEPWIQTETIQTPGPRGIPSGTPSFTVHGGGWLDTEALIDAVTAYFKAEGRLLPVRFDPSTVRWNNNSAEWENWQTQHIIFCEGPAMRDNPLFATLPMKASKGERLTIATDEIDGTHILNCGKHLVPREDGTFAAGSTYDWTQLDEQTTDEARTAILDGLSHVLKTPPRIIDQRAGVRPTTMDGRPFIGFHPELPRAAVFNGFGSKGASQVPWFAAHFRDVLAGRTDLDPEVSIDRFHTPEPFRPFRAVIAAQDAVEKHLSPGDRAIDATAGNGRDAVFLAERVGKSGRVIALDVQHEAVNETGQLLHSTGFDDRVEIVQADHADLAQVVPVEWNGTVKAVMFNLGYRPGGDKSVTTLPKSTVRALDAALGFLAQDGILSVVLYPAHAGGAEEVDAVLGWAENLPSSTFHFERILHPTENPQSPTVLLVTRT